MINFEGGMLVLNNIFSKDDVEQINAYTNHVRKEERESIIKLLEELSFTIEKVEHKPSDAYIIDRGIALIKGKQKSQSEHLTDAIQTTVWVYQEGEQK